MHEAAPSSEHIRFGPFELHVRSGELDKGQTRLKVPDQSIEILKALLERPGELVTREELRKRLWPTDTFVDFEHGLNAAVRRLREALGDSADTPKFIETLPRRGYRFIGLVEGPSCEAVAAAPSATEAKSSPTQHPPVEPVRRRRVLWPHVVVVALVLLLAAGLGWIAVTRHESASVRPAMPESIPVTAFPGVEFDAAVSPDGNHVAFAWQTEAADNPDVYVKLIDGGAAQKLTTDPANDRYPAWSPDGRRLVFLRGRPDWSRVIVIPAFGGPERVVTETQTAPASGVAWTPDGRSLVIVDRDASSIAAIFLCSVESGERRPLTQPGRDFADSSPVLSPDGRDLAFVRRIVGYSFGSVFVQRLDRLQPAGEPRRLTHDDDAANVAWAHDGDTVIYDSAGRGRRARGLWRVPASGGEPQALLTNVRATRPSVTRDASRVLYSRRATEGNIWRIPGPQLRDRQLQNDAVRLIASTFADTSPQFSARGDRIVFVSDRSGTSEIWVAQSDGSDAMPLTTFGGAYTGSPRWSHDGRFIAFDSMRSGSWNIYVVGSQGGEVRTVTQDKSNNARASWSQDGRWIYFGSNRSGDWQIWRAPSGGGAPVQITKLGGYEPFESPDGKYVYYAKPPGTVGIWRVPVDGGDEVQVLDRGRQTSWGVTEDGIVLMHNNVRPQATIDYFDFATRHTVTIGRLASGLRFDAVNPSFAASRDGRWLLFVQFDQWAADIEMLQIR